MFGSDKALEKRLAQGAGKAARALILEAKRSKWATTTGATAGEQLASTRWTWTFRVRVMPDDDQPFEATIKIKSGARVNLVVNQVINVLYDPADRRKVVIDESAQRKDMVMDAIARAKASGAKPSSHVDALERLANLRDRGVLTDAEFDAEKRKILET